jgi:hypothetical protein
MSPERNKNLKHDLKKCHLTLFPLKTLSRTPPPQNFYEYTLICRHKLEDFFAKIHIIVR